VRFSPKQQDESATIFFHGLGENTCSLQPALKSNAPAFINLSLPLHRQLYKTVREIKGIPVSHLFICRTRNWFKVYVYNNIVMCMPVYIYIPCACVSCVYVCTVYTPCVCVYNSWENTFRFCIHSHAYQC